MEIRKISFAATTFEEVVATLVLLSREKKITFWKGDVSYFKMMARKKFHLLLEGEPTRIVELGDPEATVIYPPKESAFELYESWEEKCRFCGNEVMPVDVEYEHCSFCKKMTFLDVFRIPGGVSLVYDTLNPYELRSSNGKELTENINRLGIVGALIWLFNMEYFRYWTLYLSDPYRMMQEVIRVYGISWNKEKKGWQISRPPRLIRPFNEISTLKKKGLLRRIYEGFSTEWIWLLTEEGEEIARNLGLLPESLED